MKITLELVRQILRELLGFESFTAGFISKVGADRNCPTAGITREGQLRYNPDFVKKYIQSKEDLFSLLFHEILHPLFSHFIYQDGKLEDIACDAVINAVISRIYPAESRGGNLFKKINPPYGIYGLLRPQSDMRSSSYRVVYENLYGQRNSGSRMTTGELIQTLKILSQGEDISKVILLSSHQKGDGKSRRIPSEVAARIAGEIKRTMPSCDSYAGYSESLRELFLEVLRSSLSLKKFLLYKYTIKKKIDNFRKAFRQKRRTVSPLPLCPSKRDLALLAAGIYPGYFHNQMTKTKFRKKGLAVYLDVSGSVEEHLPNIISVLRSLKEEIQTVFLFSNKVVETSFTSLLKGRIETTYGTDFDCVAQNIWENKFSKAVVFTDGYASLEDKWKQRLREQHVLTLTVLFDGRTECEDLAEFGDVVILEDVVE